MIVAKPANDLRGQWLPLIGRLAAPSSSAPRSPASSPCGSRGASPRPCSRSRAASTRSPSGNYAVRVPAGRGGDEISKLSTRFNEMAARLGGDRGARAAVPDERLARAADAADRHPRATSTPSATGSSTTRSSCRRRSTSSPAEAVRLERLVGDVLDLAKLRAHRFTVHAEEVDMEQPRPAGLRRVHRRGAPPGDRLPARRGGDAADDPHRRRPRAADRHQPAEERVPLDGRRRRRRARRLGRREGGSSLEVADDGPGHRARGARADLQPVRLRRHAGHRPRPRDRARAGARARRHASSSTRRRPAAAASGSSCRPRRRTPGSPDPSSPVVAIAG